MPLVTVHNLVTNFKNHQKYNYCILLSTTDPLKLFGFETGALRYRGHKSDWKRPEQKLINKIFVNIPRDCFC